VQQVDTGSESPKTGKARRESKVVPHPKEVEQQATYHPGKALTGVR
jgi:hypothetical protein